MKLEVSRSKSLLFLVVAAVLWSMGGFLIKWIQWNPLAIAGARSILAALFMLAIIKKPKLPRSPSQVIGAFAYAATVILFVLANKLTTAANAILLQYTSPIYVVIMSAIYLKERVYKRDLVTIAIVLGGMVLFFLDDLDPGSLLGNILALLSGLTFAVNIVCLRIQKSGSPMDNVFFGNLITALIGIPFMFGAPPSPMSWVALTLLGFFQLGLSYILFAIAIKKVTALEGALIPIIEPILNPIIVAVLIREIPGKWSIVGGVIVISSVAIKFLFSIIRPPQGDVKGDGVSIE